MFRHKNLSAQLAFTVGVVTIILALYFSSFYSYLLFHGLIEIITIAIALTLFILTWNARGFLTNDYLKIIGIGYAFIAFIDMLHTLAYKGMNVFPAFGANLPTQLWIAARYLQAATLFVAPFFVERRVDNRAILGGYAAVVSVLVAGVYSGNFPDCFIEGKGLTPFKIISEYVITAVLFVSLIPLYRKREHFNKRVFLLVVSSIICTAISEISFTAYVSVYGFANLVGHFSKLAAFYLIYRAILVTGLKEPFDLIFRDLKQAEEALHEAHDNLEEKVRERTAELREREEKYRALIESANDAIFIHEIQDDGMPGPFIEVNELSCRQLGYSREELAKLSPMELDDPRYRDRVAEAMVRLLKDGQAVFETAQMAKDGRSIPVEVSCRVIDIRGKHLLFSLVRDITERKHAEETLIRLNRELRAISDCNQALLRAVDEQTLLNDICRIICEEAGYRMAWVGYAENDDARTVRPVAWAGVEDEYLATANITWADSERGCGSTGTAVRSGESICIQDFTTDPQAAPWRDSALQHGYRSSIALPLKNENANTFGVLNIYSTEPNTFTQDETRLLEELGGDLSFGLNVLRTRAERKRAEEALQEKNMELQGTVQQLEQSRNMLQLVIESIPVRVFWKDRNSRYLGCNTLFARDAGFNHPQELLNKDDFAMGWKEQADLYRTDEHQVMESCRPKMNFVEMQTTPVGTTIWLNTSKVPLQKPDGEVFGVLGVYEDITSRKCAEAEIEHLKNYLVNIIDSMPSVLVGMDNNQTVNQWNRQAEEMSGISATEAIGKPITRLFPDFSPWITAMRSEIEQHRPASMEKLLIEKEGERRFYDLILYPLLSNGVEGTVIRIEDVTERTRIQELMIQTEKMMSVGGLAAGMAHEINNPLGIITQAIQNIERRVSPDLPANRKVAEELGVSLEGIEAYFKKRQMPQFIGSIRTASSRAAKIVANMLQFSRRAETTMQPASLAGVMDQALELAASDYDLKKKYDFRSTDIIREYADMPEVPMVLVEIEQVMLNLLKNAAQAMFANPPDRKPMIILRLHREEKYALLEVVDNGPGMEEDICRRVFDPFFTTKEPGEGTGLGLSVAYMIVTQNHKGLMEVESTPGKGTCFRVRLPILKEYVYA
jgi:PAS domain S-box-containing protein